MINNALLFLTRELNNFFRISFQLNEDKAVLSSINTINGTYNSKNIDKVIITLVNVEQETSIRSYPSAKVQDDKAAYINPPVNLNLHILFSSSFNDYYESLKFLSTSIEFFQGKNVFTRQNSPSLDEGIEKLILDLETTGYHDWNYLWGMLGSNYMPSVIYKTRMITIQEGMWTDQVPVVSNVKQNN